MIKPCRQTTGCWYFTKPASISCNADSTDSPADDDNPGNDLTSRVRLVRIGPNDAKWLLFVLDTLIFEFAVWILLEAIMVFRDPQKFGRYDTDSR